MQAWRARFRLFGEYLSLALPKESIQRQNCEAVLDSFSWLRRFYCSNTNCFLTPCIESWLLSKRLILIRYYQEKLVAIGTIDRALGFHAE
jgi:hypothetical protein